MIKAKSKCPDCGQVFEGEGETKKEAQVDADLNMTEHQCNDCPKAKKEDC